MALVLSLPLRSVAVATALVCFFAVPSALATEVEAIEHDCPALGGACGEEQVERAEAELALEMRTELLQQDAKRFRAATLAEKPPAGAALMKAPPSNGHEETHSTQHSHDETHSEQHSHEHSDTTVTVSSYNDSEMAQLVHAEQNLTKYVHQQAEVVSKSTDELSGALVKVKVSAEHSADLDRSFKQARAQAMASKERLEGFLVVLNKLKERRDGLENETAMVQNQLDQLSRQYRDVARQYRELAVRLPEEQGRNSSASDAVRSAAKQLKDAGVATGSAQGAVMSESYELQRAIDKLNQLNMELRIVEGRIMIKYAQMQSSALCSRWSAPLLLLAVALVGAPFVA